MGLARRIDQKKLIKSLHPVVDYDIIRTPVEKSNLTENEANFRRQPNEQSY